MLNLDAELELAKPRYQPTAKTIAQLDRFRHLAFGLVGPEDLLLSEDHADATGLVGRAWCPTPQAVARLRAAGADPEPHPPVSVLRAVNHRSFAHGVGLGLAAQCLVRTMADLRTLLHAGGPTGAWLLKRPLSFAGRGHFRVFGILDETAERWAQASLREDLLLAEPLVQPLVEFSLHGFLWPGRPLQLGRVCVQEVSERGAFRSVRPATGDDIAAGERAALDEAAHRASVALADVGYFGPFGIDAYRYATRE